MGSGIENYNVGLHRWCGGQVDEHWGDWGGPILWYECQDCGKDVAAEDMTKSTDEIEEQLRMLKIVKANPELKLLRSTVMPPPHASDCARVRVG